MGRCPEETGWIKRRATTDPQLHPLLLHRSEKETLCPSVRAAQRVLPDHATGKHTQNCRFDDTRGGPHHLHNKGIKVPLEEGSAEKTSQRT